MLFFFVYPESLPRLQTLQRFSEYGSIPSPVFSYSYKLPSYPAHKISSSFSYAYKLPPSQPLSFDILTNARGWYPLLLHFLVSLQICAEKGAFANPLFSIGCALFQVPYPVTPLLACPPWRATVTKTAGCIPTIPILKLTALRSQPATDCLPPSPSNWVDLE